VTAKAAPAEIAEEMLFPENRRLDINEKKQIVETNLRSAKPLAIEAEQMKSSLQSHKEAGMFALFLVGGGCRRQPNPTAQLQGGYC